MNVAISDKNRIIWVIIPKTGTESVKASRLFKDQRTVWCEAKALKTVYEQYYKVCCVRNPWDRLVSCYLNKRDSITEDFATFEAFVWWLEIKGNVLKDRHWKPQHLMVDLSILDRLIKFDYLPQGFRNVCDFVGVHADLPVLNKVPDRNPHRAYYNDQTKDIVADLYAGDIEKFEFKF